MTVDENAQTEPGAEADEITFFAPVRPTAARSMKPGDEMLVPTDEGPFPHVAYRGRITDITDDESSGTIRINGELIGEKGGLFEKPVYPPEVIQRLVMPGDPVPGTESIMVHAGELWKWIGAPFNDPNGSLEKYILRTFKRIHDDELDGEAIEVKLQSTSNPKKINTMTLLTTATIGFTGHR